MKVKFIPKKQRENIKAEKQTHLQPANYQNNYQSTHYSQYIHQSTRQAPSHFPNMQPSVKKSMAIVEEPRISEHLNARQDDCNFDQIRQRSRQAKYKSMSKDELQERVKMKTKILGLQKMQQCRRRNPQYRTQLKFQWDKSEDTTQGFVPLIPQQKSYYKAKDSLDNTKDKTWQSKEFQQMDDRDWRIFREDHQIYIRGGKAPHPIRQWTEVEGVSKILLHNLAKLNFQRPKPIQMQAIPIGMMHKDLMAIAPTGQGKTLAYLFPMINFLLPLERMNMSNFDHGPYSLILVPTRQLAEQIDEQFKKFTKGLNITSFVAVGGRQFQMQAMQMSKGCDILIATPGRAKQFIQKHQLSLQRLSWCVIDEADKMVSENLAEDLQFLLEHGGESSLFDGKKIIHMFSATMIPQVQKLGRSYLSANYTYITIGEPGGGKKEIDQHVQLVDQNAKPDRLTRIIKGLIGPMIIFVNSRQKCEKVSTMVKKRCDRSVAEYHGGKSQQQRQRVINNLRTKKVEILVATDLAGRGLDVKGINAVINYDAPKNISQFVHRSGRTGRAGMKGKAYTLLTADDEGIFYDLRVFFQRNQFSMPQNLKEHPASMVRPGGIVNIKRSKQIVYTN